MSRQKISCKITLSLCAVLLFGCGSDVSVVKGSYYEINESLPIGKAFDTWSFCIKSSWQSEETARGERLVTFSCEIDPKLLVEAVYAHTAVSSKLKGIESHIQLNSAVLEVDWLVNHDDTISYPAGYYHYTWADGLSFTVAHPSNDLMLNDVYSDNTRFSTSQFGQHARNFYAMAKAKRDKNQSN